MNNLKNVASNVPATTNDRQVTNLHNATTSTGKNLTGKQLERKIKSEARKATNEAGRIMAKEAKAELFNLKTLRFVLEHSDNLQSFVSEWLSALSKETGKNITLKDILRVPVAAYIDYVKDAEATRGVNRSGITPDEFKNIMNRYYRGELCKRVDISAAPVLVASWERDADKLGA